LEWDGCDDREFILQEADIDVDATAIPETVDLGFARLERHNLSEHDGDDIEDEEDGIWTWNAFSLRRQKLVDK
jgi:hypothetical protein